MPRDHVSIPQQNLLWVALMGVGLLTFAFVMGVQTGKQGAALRGPKAKTLDEEVRELPEPLTDQLRVLESLEAGTRPVETPKPEPPREETAAPERWTLQLLSTKDAAEARKLAEKAKAAGFKTRIVKEDGLHKVRLDASGPKAALNAPSEKLKKAGFKPFAVKE